MPEQRLELKRHYVSLTPEETDEVVGIIADLIVGFLKVRQDERTQTGGKECSPKRTEPAAASAGK